MGISREIVPTHRSTNHCRAIVNGQWLIQCATLSIVQWLIQCANVLHYTSTMVGPTGAAACSHSTADEAPFSFPPFFGCTYAHVYHGYVPGIIWLQVMKGGMTQLGTTGVGLEAIFSQKYGRSIRLVCSNK